MPQQMQEVLDLARMLPSSAQARARTWIQRLYAPTIIKTERETRDKYALAFADYMRCIIEQRMYTFAEPFDKDPGAGPLSYYWQNDQVYAYAFAAAAANLKDSISELDMRQENDLQLARSVSSEVDYINEKSRMIDDKMNAMQENDWQLIRELEKSVNACKTKVDDANPYPLFYSLAYIYREEQGLEDSHRLAEELIGNYHMPSYHLARNTENHFAYNCCRMIDEIRQEVSLLRSRAAQQRQAIERIFDALAAYEPELMEVRDPYPEYEFDVYDE